MTSTEKDSMSMNGTCGSAVSVRFLLSDTGGITTIKNGKIVSNPTSFYLFENLDLPGVITELARLYASWPEAIPT